MKALLLDGSLKNDFDMIRSSIIEELERNRFEVESILLRDVKVAACQGDFECWLQAVQIVNAFLFLLNLINYMILIKY